MFNFSNDDHPSESEPGSGQLVQAGHPVDLEKNRAKWDLDDVGQPMPPPKAVAAGRGEPLSDEDRRTIVRWIDLGCPIELDYDPPHPRPRGYGRMLDDARPTLTLTLPRRGANRDGYLPTPAGRGEIGGLEPCR